MNTIRILISQNIRAAVILSLLSVPLGLALALAAQAAPTTGIITAVWAGLAAALFGSSPYTIIGPTGGLAGLLATYAMMHGADSLSSLALIAGLFVVIAYVFHLDKYLIFIPASAIQGFMLGISIITILNQINPALGLELPQQKKFIHNVIYSCAHLHEISLINSAVFLFFLIALILLKRTRLGLSSIILLTPVAVSVGYVTTHWFVGMSLATIASKYTHLQRTLYLPPLWYFDRSLLVSGFAVALIIILGSLVNTKITNSLSKTRRNQRKEILGVGIANIVSGLCGGLPATASLDRSILMVSSGAQHMIAKYMMIVGIAAIWFFLFQFVGYIPLAVLAAFLVFLSLQMIEVKQLINLYLYDTKGFVVSIVVACVCIIEDPTIGIVLGSMLALLLFIEQLSHGPFDLVVHDVQKGTAAPLASDKLPEGPSGSDVFVYSIKGELVYINCDAHINRFEQELSGYRAVVLRLSGLAFIDAEGVDAINQIIDIVQKKGGVIVATGVRSHIDYMLRKRHGAYAHLYEQGLVFTRTQQALAYLHTLFSQK